jgi:alpha-glucosidase (family GH31 glycosyl hydrolase)
VCACVCFRYGYPSVAYVDEVVKNYSAAGIPLETQWMDIDYMDKYLDFTLDPVSFSQSDMTAFISSLHSQGQHYIPIIDPGIYVRDDSYEAYSLGLEQGVFVMDMTGEQPYLGQVWPGPTYFPDWFAPNTLSWWGDQLQKFHDIAAFDGLCCCVIVYHLTFLMAALSLLSLCVCVYISMWLLCV